MLVVYYQNDINDASCIVKGASNDASNESNNASYGVNDASKDASNESNNASYGVNDASKDASNKKRLSKNELYNEIVEICLDYKSLERISKEINKSLNYLKDRIIPKMLELGLLERKYPDTPRHPQQEYRKKNKIIYNKKTLCISHGVFFITINY